MKKIFILFIAILLIFNGSVFAQLTGDEETSVRPIAEVMNVPDDTWVTVEGYVLKQMQKDRYLFKDNTGEIAVEIKRDLWEKKRVDPKTKVRIYGKVDLIRMGTSDIGIRIIMVETIDVIK